MPGGLPCTGRIKQLTYDCFGAFEGFVLEDCSSRRTFTSCERGIKEVARYACRERLEVTVITRDASSDTPSRLIVHCC